MGIFFHKETIINTKDEDKTKESKTIPGWFQSCVIQCWAFHTGDCFLTRMCDLMSSRNCMFHFCLWSNRRWISVSNLYLDLGGREKYISIKKVMVVTALCLSSLWIRNHSTSHYYTLKQDCNYSVSLSECPCSELLLSASHFCCLFQTVLSPSGYL